MKRKGRETLHLDGHFGLLGLAENVQAVITEHL